MMDEGRGLLMENSNKSSVSDKSEVEGGFCEP